MENLQDRIQNWEKKEMDIIENLKQNGSLGKLYLCYIKHFYS